MDALASQSSPAADSAWSGRAWWEMCCGGCCLGIIAAAVLASIGGFLFSKGAAPKPLVPYAERAQQQWTELWSRFSSSGTASNQQDNP